MIGACMVDGRQMLGELTVARTYAKTKEDGTKENWNEITDRYVKMMISKHPSLSADIIHYSKYIHDKKMVPSMRLMQFSDVIDRNNVRAYNCSYLNIDCVEAIREIPFLLSCGSGVGVGVLRRFTDRLPTIRFGHEDFYVIEDNKESWSYSFEYLIKNPQIEFDYSLIRPAGAPLSSGGTASGPEPLRQSHEDIRKILHGSTGRKLKPIEVHDITCFIARAIVSGGVRRSAIITLFDCTDTDMLMAKTGDWYVKNSQRGLSNNTAVIFKDENAHVNFKRVLDVGMNGWGEPGILWHNPIKNYDDFRGINPCGEISLKNMGLCNLTESIGRGASVGVNSCNNPKEFIETTKACAFFGTLQASLTDFHFLRPEWKINAEEEALLGVSITGQAMCDWLTPEVMREGALAAVETNRETAKRIGINPAKRVTCTKPSGSTSAALGVTSGIHAAHSEFFIRRIRTSKLSPLGKYLTENFEIKERTKFEKAKEKLRLRLVGIPVIGNVANFLLKEKYLFVEEDCYDTKNLIISVPCTMPNTVTRNEGTLALLERMKNCYVNWVLPGHIEGEETHNVSLTCTYKENEKRDLKRWMWENKDFYRGVAILPYSGSYPQAPFQEISERHYKEVIKLCPQIDVGKIVYDDESRKQVAGCQGGSCEVTF